MYDPDGVLKSLRAGLPWQVLEGRVAQLRVLRPRPQRRPVRLEEGNQRLLAEGEQMLSQTRWMLNIAGCHEKDGHSYLFCIRHYISIRSLYYFFAKKITCDFSSVLINDYIIVMTLHNATRSRRQNGKRCVVYCSDMLFTL